MCCAGRASRRGSRVGGWEEERLPPEETKEAKALGVQTGTTASNCEQSQTSVSERRLKGEMETERVSLEELLLSSQGGRHTRSDLRLGEAFHRGFRALQTW